MQNLKDSTFSSLSFFSLALVIILIGISGCENPGSVGTGLTPPGAEVVIDTVNVNGIDSLHTNANSGGLTYFSAGQYNDPLFGNLSATGMLEPSMPSARDTLHKDDKMMMRIILNGNQVYGDTAASQDFDIYEIGEYWSATNRKVKDDIKIDSNAKVGSFTVGQQDSIDVELSQTWYDKYYNYATDTTLAASEADSVFQHNVYGLALVAQNSNKIIPLDASSTRFVITSQDSDTVSVRMAKWAYSLDRSNESYPQHSIPLLSTFESVFDVNPGLSKIDYDPSTVSKTELILYQNNDAMDQSLQSGPSTVQRPPEKNVQLHIISDSLAIPENIDTPNPFTEGQYNAADGAYHMDITSLTQQILLDKFPEGQKFYITFSNNGVITSSLVYSDSTQSKAPKIVITHLKNTNK
ncbi:MAG TPA: hypothetical protein VJ964_09110 [Balneolaceae bacterium]|nr:hypothetical protein [Balneolaceae bacterium]